MKKIVFGAGLFALPFIAAAQAVTDASTLFAKVNNILNALIPIFISIAVVYLIYAIVRYVIAGNEEEKEAGKKMMIWGVIGLFVILSIWGIVNVLVKTLNLDNQVRQDAIPSTLPFRNPS